MHYLEDLINIFSIVTANMQESIRFKQNFLTRFGKIISVFIILGISIIPLSPSLAHQERKILTMMISHKIIPNNINNFFTYLRLNALTLVDELCQARSRRIKDSDNLRSNNYYCYYSYSYDNNTSKSKKMLHRSFRIPEDILKALESQANTEEIPVSNLVNRILRNYFVTQSRSKKTDFIITNKDFFRRVFAKILEGDKNIEDYGKELGYAIVSEYTSTFFPEINSHTLIQFLKSWFNRFQSYQHRFDEENSRIVFSLNHDINMNFSMILKIILEGLIEPITKSSVVFAELTSGSITFAFEV